jgi:hypothetical protein
MVEPWYLKTKFWIQIQWCASESPTNPLPLNMTWGWQQLIKSRIVLQNNNNNNNNNKFALTPK